MNISIREATIADMEMVATLVHQLLTELRASDEELPDAENIHATTKELFADNNPIWAFLAESKGKVPLGVLTLNENAAIYAGGRFGKISELYVTKDGRSKGVGAKLLSAAKEFALLRGWKRLEVGAPEVPRWKRTVSFYRGNGFVEVGPRLKLPL